MKNKIAIIILSCFLLNIFLITSVHAQGIKAQMKERLPIINNLKAKGVIGENNKGFLEFRGGSREKADVVNAENADRKKVYASIASKQGSSPDHVGKRRAAQLKTIARPGEWLQKPDGQWYKK